jgi:hypothetical protein
MLMRNVKNCRLHAVAAAIFAIQVQLSIAFAMTDALDRLLPLSDVTHTAITSGNWSARETWGGPIPGDNSHVHIPNGIHLHIDRELPARISTIRLEGKLSFDPNSKTQLLFETLGSWPDSLLQIGTVTQSITADHSATLLVIDSAPIDTSVDFAQLGKGLILMGEVRMHGSEKIAWSALAETPSSGDSIIQLLEPPHGWSVGDSIVIAGTQLGNPSSDEQRLISNIEGSRISLDQPLFLDHHAPRAELNVHVANLTRNIVIASEYSGEEIGRRGHVMFMHNLNVDIRFVRFHRLGRTDKRVQVDDWFFPTLEADVYEAGPRTNIRGRYSIHFHRGGVDPVATSPALVQGCVVEDDPGWAYVNHSSNVIFADNVSYNVVGGAFQTESGDEIGAFRRNIAIRTINPDYPMKNEATVPVDIRESSQDFAFQGCGFWFHGGGVIVEDNIASGTTGHAFIYWTEGQREVGTEFDLQNMFKVSNIPNGQLLGSLDSIQSWWVPLRAFKNNTGYAASKGFAAYYIHATLFEDITQLTKDYLQTVHSTLEDLTLWNVEMYGVEMQNCERFTFKNLTLINAPRIPNPENPIIGIFNAVTVARQSIWENCRVEGFDIGMIPPMQGTVSILGGHFANSTDFALIPPQRDSRAPGWDRDLRIDGTTFGPRPESGDIPKIRFHLMGLETLQGSLAHIEPEFQSLFFLIPDRIVVNVEGLAEQRLYYAEQAPGFVPISDSNIGIACGQYAAEIMGRSNAELHSTFGLSFAGALLPSNAAKHPEVEGGFVSPVDPLMNVPACHFVGEPLLPANSYDDFDFCECWETSPAISASTSRYSHPSFVTGPPASITISNILTPLGEIPSKWLLRIEGSGHHQIQRSVDLLNWTSVQSVEIIEDSTEILLLEDAPAAFYRLKKL